MPRPDTRWAVLGWKNLPPSNLTSVEETRIHCLTWAGSIAVCGAMSGEGRVGMAGEERAARPAPRNPDTFFLVQTSRRLDRARSSC